MRVECRKCGIEPWQGATLHRQNPLGEIGIWEYEACGVKADPSVAELVKDIQDAQLSVNLSKVSPAPGTSRGRCELCDNCAELRPYGPCGESICFKCTKGVRTTDMRGSFEFGRALTPDAVDKLLAQLERAETDARRYRKWRELKTMSLIPGPLFMAMFENETDAALDSLILEDQPC